MSFLQLVRREMHGSLQKLLIMSGIGGVSNASILAAINAGVQDTGSVESPACGRRHSFWSRSSCS